ncbi:MAG: energy-coupling factor transporter transmembrane protein EcfT [Ruminococcaceae bacterium]|nr:energy-coupling factor transporter transmembrane protein EcfT [Oscillospiraceae bacterium]
MIGEVTIGQYFPGNSLLHKLDPRMKTVLIFLLMVAVFFCKNYISMGCMTLLTVAIVIISKINIKVIFKGIRPILFVVLFTTVLNLFYGTGEPIITLGFIKITESGIHNAVFMAMRIILLVAVGLMLTYTTTPNQLTDAMESLLKPLKVFRLDIHSLAMTMTIALRFIPILIEEVDKIMAAQKSRGADMESGGFLKRVKAIIPVLIPLFISSFRRANELADAMECRCYRGGEGRTKMNVNRLVLRDYISLCFVIAFFAGIILLRIFTQSVI